MYFPALLLGLRRVGRGLVYELFQLALWVAFWLHTLSSLRSAFGGKLVGRSGPAIRPRRNSRPARSGRITPAAAV
ncbi:hypothetical protein GCM10022409_37700 [Hymenobacter glaciei]|uniref:Transposase DDE domain-containing protein n=1 Tax=Hymenobacter glaciei TaxID=877209 RepID=A0ABP7UMR7_9BACT